MPFHRITDQCSKCGCYYTNWCQETERYMKEHDADYVECTHELNTSDNTPCVCFSPKEEEYG
jgi:hypothetical protein